MNADAYIPDARVLELKKAALSGDSEAALELRSYYEFWKYDLGTALAWHKVALENGDPSAMQSEAEQLMSSDRLPDPNNYVRARYWLNILLKNQWYRHAAQVDLERLDELEKKPSADRFRK